VAEPVESKALNDGGLVDKGIPELIAASPVGGILAGMRELREVYDWRDH
jgi:hypothetical protein